MLENPSCSRRYSLGFYLYFHTILPRPIRHLIFVIYLIFGQYLHFSVFDFYFCDCAVFMNAASPKFG